MKNNQEIERIKALQDQLIEALEKSSPPATAIEAAQWLQIAGMIMREGEMMRAGIFRSSAIEAALRMLEAQFSPVEEFKLYDLKNSGDIQDFIIKLSQAYALSVGAFQVLQAAAKQGRGEGELTAIATAQAIATAIATAKQNFLSRCSYGNAGKAEN